MEDDRKIFSAEIEVPDIVKQKADDAFAKISTSDIKQPMQIVDNPLIGSIPTREEIAEELDQLLMCM